MKWRTRTDRQANDWQGLIDIAEMAALLGLFWLFSFLLGL